MSQFTNAEGFQETAVVSVVEGEFQVTLPPPAENRHLDFLVGDWAGSYTMAGMKFEVRATAKWAYNHQYIQAENRGHGPVGLVESKEMWQPTEREDMFRLFYFDPFGGAGLGQARKTETGFVIQGDDPSTGPFRNTITCNGDDEMLFQLDLGPDEEGNFRTIGGGQYTRVRG